MNPDRPIMYSEQDAFERLEFAKHLSSFLCLNKYEPSIIVGIDGKWGDGKTSCINLIKEILTKNYPRPIIVDYHPWLISTLDSVIEGFFIELASAIGEQSKAKNARTAAHKVLQFGKMLAPIKLIPGVEPWGTMVESVFSTVGGAAKAGAELTDLSLQTRKADLQKSLSRIDRPLVVIIDDIDRLPPDNVRIVFQMIKAVCDFDRVSYLIAYDPQPVRNALSYGEVYDGERYLEKIVQVSYKLPRLSFTNMKDYLKKNIDHFAEQYSLELTGIEADLFEILFNRTDIIRVLETPRDVNRLCNRLRLSAPNTRNEVSFSDLVAFEVLELKFPELSNIIRTEPDRFVARIGIDEEFISEDTFVARHIASTDAERKNEKQTPLDLLLRKLNYNERKRDFAKSILLFMFPHLAGKNYHEIGMPDSINRVRKRDALLKLLHCGSTSFTYSTQQAQRFCSLPEERIQILAQYDDEDDFYGWISYLCEFILSSKVQLVNPLSLCDLLHEEVQKRDAKSSLKSLPRLLGEFLYNIIRNQNDHTTRYNMLSCLVDSIKSLALSEYTLICFLKDYGIWSHGKYIPVEESAISAAESLLLEIFSYKDLYSAKDRWLASVRNAVASQDLIESQKDILSIFFRWGQLNNNDYTEVQDYVMKCSKNDQWLQKYLSLFNVKTNAENILPFIPEDLFDSFLDRISSLAERDEHAATIKTFLEQVLKEKLDKKEGFLQNKGVCEETSMERSED